MKIPWRVPLVLVLILGPVGHLAGAEEPELVSFPTRDGGVVYADLFGGDPETGPHAVVLAHGGRFNKESWSEQIPALVDAGLQVLALDFRGRGKSRGGPDAPPGEDGAPFDVLAAMEYLASTGAERISLVGASFGGWAVGVAAAQAPPEITAKIDRIVLLAHSSIGHPEQLPGCKLFVTTRGDFSGDGTLRLPRIREQYEGAPEPKRLLVLEGDAHAEFIFDTEQGPRLLREIVAFLTEPAGACSGP